MANKDWDFIKSPSFGLRLANASPTGMFLDTTKGSQFQFWTKSNDQVFKSTGAPLMFNFCPVASLILYILLYVMPPLVETVPDHPLAAGLSALY